MTAVVTLEPPLSCSPAGTTTTTSTSCPIATPDRGWRQLSGGIILLCFHVLTRFRNGPPCGSVPAKGSFLYNFQFFFSFWLKFSSRLFPKINASIRAEPGRAEPVSSASPVRFWARQLCDLATLQPFCSADAQKPMELQLSARYLIPRRPKIR